MKIRSALHAQPNEFEALDEKSMTVPDQSLTVRDIITRFTRGQIAIPPVETGESETFDDAHSFDDMVDVADAIRVGNETLSRIQNNGTTIQNNDTQNREATSQGSDTAREETPAV